MKGAVVAAVLGIAAIAALVTWRAPAADRGAGRPAVGPTDSPSARLPTAASATEASAPDRHRPAAAGGVAILASAARAQAVVAGVVSEVTSLDVHGWRAALRVDGVLRGNVRLGDIITIAWEELSATRQVRFADGQRVLVVLDALPTQSLWRTRFPAAAQQGTVTIVAARGDAFLTEPDGVTLGALEHYLALTPEARDGAPGARRLAELVRGAQPSVAREALALLEAEPARVATLDGGGAAAFLAAARGPEREPALRGTALRLAAAQRLTGTRETAEALSAPGSPIRVDAYRALAALPDGLSPEQRERLVADADPDLRAVGVELAGGQVSRERLVALVRGDPSPPVRLAAGSALLARDGGRAVVDVVGLLDDPDDGVRGGIAERIGALGAAAVGPLAAVVDDGSERAALAAVLGLSYTGREGAVMLSSIAEAHEKESVRAFARLAFGQAPGHTH